MQILNTLKPEPVWKYFEEILAIPRPSKKEDKIISYIKDFVETHALDHKQDKAGNILITKAATSNNNQKIPLVLQSHLDMVCEKNEESKHNFETDPIDAFIDEDWIKARGTTLGADNGIGVAIQLAVLADKRIQHGPLECLFTVDEETGMTGAFELENGFFSGNTLINLDSEDEGEVFIGCAGGIDTLISFPVKYLSMPDNSKCITIKVKGLSGGHSGDDINKGRGNALKIMARILWNIPKQLEFKLCAIEGGNLRNAIPRESFAIIGIKPEQESAVINYIVEQVEIVTNEFKNESGLTIDFEVTERIESYFDPIFQDKLISSMHACPNGVIEMSIDIPGLVETSTNLASVHASGREKMEIVTSQRSSVESAKYDVASRIRSLFELAGAIVTHTDSYPGWTPDTDSKILRVTENSYKKLFQTNPQIKAIHAGLECGLFLEKYPGLDMVSIGPTIRGAHSPDERMEISSVEKFWKLLLDILQSIPEIQD